MKNNLFNKVIAMAFVAFAAMALPSSVSAVGYLGENDELDGCAIGEIRQFAEVKQLVGYTDEGLPVYLVTTITWCQKLPPKPTAGF